jgi:hypothetical protein
VAAPYIPPYTSNQRTKSSVIAAATTGMLKADGTHSCVDVMFRLIREVHASYASNFVRYRTSFVECLHIIYLCSMFWNWKHFIHGIVEAAMVVS